MTRCASDSCGCESGKTAAAVAPAQIADGVSTTLAIVGMDCPTEEALIRDKLAALPGIGDLSFNLMQRTLTLRHAPDALAPAIEAIHALGMEASQAPDEAAAATPATAAWWPLALSGVAATAAEAVHWFDGGNHWIEAGLALVAILAGGLPTYKKGWIALRNGNLNMNALMSIAVTGALLIGEWPEGAMVMFLFALAEVIEAKSLDRARNAIRGLMALAPETATVLQDDGSWVEVTAAKVPLAARVRVRPGERIALDGMIVSGRSAVNQAPITGESLPADKAEGDPVFAGTINEAGSFEYRVTATATQSTLARIIHAVEEAQGTRAPTQRFVDRFARVYTPAVFAVAVGMALIPPLLMDAPWFDAGLQGPGAAGHCLPLRAGDLDAGDDRQRARDGGPPRHPDQGRRVSGRGSPARRPGTRQDRHADPRPAGANRLRTIGGRRRCDPAPHRRQPRRTFGPSGVAGGGPGGSREGSAAVSVDEFAALPGRGVRGRIDGRVLPFRQPSPDRGTRALLRRAGGAP
jgi:Cd2+/Zn2+-exporting ATPase